LHFFCKNTSRFKRPTKSNYSDYKIPIIAKIEMPEALENIDKIVAFVMVDGRSWRSRVELPAHEVPLVQKELIQSKNGKNSSYCCYPNDGDNDYQFNSYKS
jgi:pyruvate kinase